MSTINSPDQSEQAARAITDALYLSGGVATHATARLIAAAIHPGPESALARFASSGRFDPEVLLHEIDRLVLLGRAKGWSRALRDYVVDVRARSHPWARSALADVGSSSSPSAHHEASADSRHSDEERVELGTDGDNEIATAGPGADIARRPTRIDKSLVLTIPETADRLRVSMWTVYRLIREKKLQTIQIGTRRLVPLFSLHAFLRRQTDGEGDRP